MTVPNGVDLVLLTKPYYRSTYVFVYANKKLRLHSFDDPVLRKMRIGIHAFGEEGTSPAALALSSRGIIDQIVGFTILDTKESPKGSIIDAVTAGQIDVAVVWGPFGGYFAKQQPVKLEVVPIAASPEPTPIPFAFNISIGVRRGNSALKQELEDALDRRHDEIQKILSDYGVPLVAAAQPALSAIPPHPDNKATNIVKPAI
jgi:ABC-type amino acid transport substrate-binding protein